ncbi:MICAL-like protein 2 isoform X1 [Crotalus tigris]|uniref:MICAL-like protein 2 isoform X1 n=1 Tax=Crotalus tigris TaxID=88082 RepID=UPI00192F60F2|nr:MICAL-like protein 2 isoform X1 [Crotalus tigris]
MSKWLPSLGQDRLQRKKSSAAIYFLSAADILFIIPVVEQHMNPGQPEIPFLLLSRGALEEFRDFTSLSKENVFENNALAFRVAEKELGIPALLDAEDMVALKVPDRLSILTYVSQYYNYFHGKSPIGGMAGIKRPASQPSEQPTEKRGVPGPRAPSSTQPARPSFLEPKAEPAVVGRRLVMDSPPSVERRVLAEKNTAQPSNCAICGTHVHLVQRLLMDGKLYHRNCFRCKKCSSTLQRGNYQAGLSPGTFLCNRHAGAEPAQVPPAQESRAEKKTTTTSKTPSGNCGKGLEPPQAASPVPKPRRVFQNNVTLQPAAAHPPPNSWSPKTGRVSTSPSLSRSHPPAPSADLPVASSSMEVRSRIQQAREKFFQADPASSGFPERKPEPARNHSSSPVQPTQVPEKTPLSRTQLPVSSSINSTNDSKKDEARSILQRVLPGPQPSTSQSGGVSSTAVPRSLAYNSNPSSPALSNSRGLQPQNSPASKPFIKPAFADAQRGAETPHRVGNLPKDPSHKVEVGAEPQSKVKDGSIGTSANAGCKSDTKVVKVKNASGAEEKLENPEDWRARLKPVKPPHQDATKLSPKPADVHKVLINIEVKPGQNDKKPPLLVMSPAAPNSAPLAVQLLKKKLLVPQLDTSISWQKEKLPWESQPATAKAEKWSPSKTVVAAAQPSSLGTFWKHPGDQAISPTKLHPDYIPEEEIRKEMRQIERDLDRLEQKGIPLEKQLRACEGDNSEDTLMVEWFKLIHEKQILLRRESELMHKINQQKLEVKQWDIETELRSLISKADNLKTAKEKAREKELLDSYLDTVNDRNKIVEDLDEDRLRELEEDEMFVDMIKKFGVSRSPQDNEKRKNKFGFFRILKTKN